MDLLVSVALPITALLVDDRGEVWFGEGPCVKRVVGETVSTLCTLDTVHCIRIIKQSSDGLIVAAGASVFAVDRTGGGAVVKIDLAIQDWILDIFIDADGTAVCATAHGHVCKVSLHDHVVCNSWHLSDHALFYSAHLISSDTVAFGTIFSGLWMYSLHVGAEELRLEGKLQGHHKGSIFGICSNSRHLVTCSDDRSIAVWGRTEWELCKVLKGHDARVWCIACDDQSVVSGSEDGTVRWWSLTSNQTKVLAHHSGKHVWSVSVGHGIVHSGGGDGALKVSWPPDLTVGLVDSPDVKAFHVSADNSLFVLRSDGCVVKNGVSYYQSKYLCKFGVFDSVADWLGCGDLSGHLHVVSRRSGAVTVHSVSDSKILKLAILSTRLVLLQDARLRVVLLFLDDALNVVRRAVNCFDAVITSVVQADKLLVLGTRPGTLIFADLNLSAQFSLAVGGGGDAVTGLVLHMPHLFFCTRGGHTGVVDVAAQRAVSIEPAGPVSHEGLYRDGTQLCTFGFHNKDFVVQRVSDKDVLLRHPCGGGHRLWQFVNHRLYYLRDQRLCWLDASTPSLGRSLKPGLHGAEVRCIMDHRGQLISGGEDGQLILLDTSLRPKYKLKFESSVRSIARLSRDAVVACGTKELLVLVTVLHSDGQPVLGLRSKAEPVADVENVRNMCLWTGATDESVLWVGSSEGAIRRWRTHHAILSFEAAVFKCDNCVMALAVVGGVICAGTSNGELYMLDMHGKLLQRWQVHGGAIMAMAVIMAQPSVLLCGGDDGWISVVDVQCRRLRHKWQAHSSSVTALHIDSHAGRLYSASVDQSVCCWDVDGFSLVWRRRVPLTDAGCMCTVDRFLLFVGGRGLVSLDVGCAAAPACTGHTKRLRGGQSSTSDSAASPTTAP